MLRRRFCYKLAALGLATLFASCTGGGSSPTPSNPGTGGVTPLSNITVIPTGSTGSSAVVAYQTGNSAPWKLLSSGQTTIPAGTTGAFGIAYVCPGSPDYVFILESTATETSTVPIACGLQGSVSGNYNVAAVSGATGMYDEQSNSYSGATGSYSFDTYIPGTQDIFFAANNSVQTLAVKTIQAVSVPASGVTGVAASFEASDAVGPRQTLTVSNEPTTQTSEYSYAFFGEPGFGSDLYLSSASASSMSYETVASGDIGSNDAYDAEGVTYVSGPGTADFVVGDTYSPSPPTTVALPNAFNATAPSASTQPTYTLNYSGLSSVSGGFGGYYVIENLGTNPDVNIEAFVSSGFVVSCGAVSYKVPNITLMGFPPMVSAAGDSFTWYLEAIWESSPAFTPDLSVAQSRSAQSLLNRPRAQPLLRSLATTVRTQSMPTTGSDWAAQATGTFTTP